ncbi:hypothetical protein [Ponticaulis profundi]|uniref:Flagellar FliJ protein n=1 Tax=Ponticaulis profundi TaxID=2665222 RepID=A0ABW1S525_9PROT
MRTLEILLKRANRQMEELAIKANQVVAHRNDLITRRATCEAATTAEAAMIDGSPLASMGFAAYLDLQKQRLRQFDEELQDVEAQHEAAQRELSRAFAEVKKLEMLIARQKEAKRLEDLQTEQSAFDERSSQMFGRN